MASSSGDENAKEILMSPGGLVWVRRKDESWWPGQVLCRDELPRSSSSSSQRAGAPVLLLGRGVFGRSIGMNWYDLKRKAQVRPFRCEVFGRWIEEAKDASKEKHLDKRSKYARRNEAILQALQIEEEWLHSNNVHPREEDEDSSEGICIIVSEDEDQFGDQEEIIEISSDTEFLLSPDRSFESDKSADELHLNKRRSERRRTQVAHVDEFLEMEKHALWYRELVAKRTATKPRKGLSPFRRRNDGGSARTSTLVWEWLGKGKRSSRRRKNYLYNVNLVDRNTRKRPKVHMIRLMNRANNYAIVGYPINVEVIPETVHQDKGPKKEQLEKKKREGEVAACVPLTLVFNRISQAFDGKSASKI